jgi:hypothetical protein
MIEIQATFVGYGGEPASVFSAYDTDTGILVVSVEAAYRATRRKNAVVLTNAPDIARDKLFGERDFSSAIDAYFTLRNGRASDGKNPRLVFGAHAARANPENAIERDGYDTSGARYRLSESITCAQVATLATCQYALKAAAIEAVVNTTSVYNRLAHGGIVTV